MLIKYNEKLIASTKKEKKNGFEMRAFDPRASHMQSERSTSPVTIM